MTKEMVLLKEDEQYQKMIIAYKKYKVAVKRNEQQETIDELYSEYINLKNKFDENYSS